MRRAAGELSRAIRAASVGLAALATPASAHSPLPGLEGFYFGLIHPLSSAAQVLALLGLGAALGAAPLGRFAAPLAALALGLLAGVLGAAVAGPGAPDPDRWVLGLACLSALTAALLPGRAAQAVPALAAATGVLLGWATVHDLGVGPAQDRAITIAGSVVGGFLAVLYLAGALAVLRERVRHPAVAIGLRVAAAWVCAVAILMLALLLAPAPSGTSLLSAAPR